MTESFNLAPEAGLEPATFSLTANCSTIELLRNNRLIIGDATLLRQTATDSLL